MSRLSLIHMSVSFSVRKMWRRSISITLLLLPSLAVFAEEGSCTYSTYQWNTVQKKAVNYRKVKKSRAEITPFERDADTGCTVCEEDQLEIQLPGLPPFRMCRRLASGVEAILLEAQKRGHKIDKLVGYRNGMTRGDVDAEGNRTRFSNHSFGIAIDINQASNGLYNNCFSWGDQCQLTRGGAWRPDSDPQSLSADHFLVQELKKLGFKWGGEIAGRQKDFMHFSPSGY